MLPMPWGWNIDGEKSKRRFAKGRKYKEDPSRRGSGIFVGSEEQKRDYYCGIQGYLMYVGLEDVPV